MPCQAMQVQEREFETVKSHVSSTSEQVLSSVRALEGELGLAAHGWCFTAPGKQTSQLATTSDTSLRQVQTAQQDVKAQLAACSSQMGNSEGKPCD